MFQFKRFAVEDSGSAMKVGTDGVLIGAWCSVDAGVKRILDIGAGSGLIALMLAQRTENFENMVEVEGVEIDEASVVQARENVEGSPWSDRVAIHHCDFKSFDSGCKYDLIVSNPPYFVDSLLPPGTERSVARHTTELSFEALVKGVVTVLCRRGRFAVVLPVEATLHLDDIVDRNGSLRLVRRCGVQNSEGKAMKRYMSEYIFFDDFNGAVESDLLYVREGSPLDFSAGYRALTRDFYLKF